MDYICTSCNYVGEPKKILGGSNLVSIFLWLILPTIYFVWKFNSVFSQLTQDPFALLQAIESEGLDFIDIFLTLAGPVYSIWRRIKKQNACMKCGEKILVPVRSKSEINIVNNDEDLSAENLKKIPYLWEKDVREYKEKQQNASSPIADQKEYFAKLKTEKTPDSKFSSGSESKEQW